MKKWYTILFCCLILALCGTCNRDVTAKGTQVQKRTKQESQIGFVIKNKQIELHIEDEAKIRLRFAHGRKQKVKFRSMNRKIATVNRKGIVTGKKPGTAVIKVTDQRRRVRKCKVIVTQGYTLSFEQEQVALKVGQMVSNKAVMSHPLREKIFYESSNEQVATVDEDGNILARKAGQVIVTAEGLQNRTQCLVTVTDDIYNDMATFTAHRGYRERKYKENTMSAFQNAVQNGFRGIETDIRVTADGEFVLAHDACIWQCGYTCPKDLVNPIERNGSIALLTYEELDRLTDGRIARLSDYLDYVKNTGVHSYLEIKTLLAYDYPTVDMVGGDDGDLLYRRQTYQVKRLLTMIYERGMTEQVTISGFHTDYLELVRRQDSKIAIQYTIGTKNIDIAYLKQYNFGVDMPLQWATPDILQECKKNHIRLGVYCADTREDMFAAVKMQVDNIMSNKCLFSIRQ